jgi:hypothetical protein
MVLGKLPVVNGVGSRGVVEKQTAGIECQNPAERESPRAGKFKGIESLEGRGGTSSGELIVAGCHRSRGLGRADNSRS